MTADANRPFHRGLRFKLFLVSLTLLAIPWAGYRFVAETEAFLGLAQEQVLLGRAELAANLLPESARDYLDETNRSAQQPFSDTFHAYQFKNPLQLDGYPDEWRHLYHQRRRFLASAAKPNTLAFDLLVGFNGENLYLLIQVEDDKPLYAVADTQPRSGDHLLIALPGRQGRTRQYVMGTSAPGWLVAYDLDKMLPEPSILGEWQESASGYTIELQLPRGLAQDSISLAVVDRDTRNPDEALARAATSGLRYNVNLSLILYPKSEIQGLLRHLTKDDMRIRIVNHQGQVIGEQGSINTRAGQNGGLLSRLRDVILATDEITPDSREEPGRLDGPEIRSALRGEPAVFRHRDAAQDSVILSAAYPIGRGGKNAGAVIIEQTTDSVLSIQRRAQERLIFISLTLFLFTGVSLLFFASRLTGRISRISRKIDRAVSGEGRINTSFIPDLHKDELGDMERNFAAVMQRLQEYNRYLEAMASRLAHELRTPLSVVRTSLENLNQIDEAAARARYLARAMQGTDRLSLILDRMREASRLEQSLESAERERVDLTSLISQVTENYRESYPDTGFACQVPELPLSLFAAPDLLVQALDKLISNAVDFHTPGSSVRITLDSVAAESCRIRVINQGPALPQGMQGQLFDSMVSIRAGSDGDPHLGLGLYLVRLICEFHQGSVSAENTGDGVCFTLYLPLH